MRGLLGDCAVSFDILKDRSLLIVQCFLFGFICRIIVSVRENELKGIWGNDDLRFLFAIPIQRENTPYSGSVGFNQTESVKDFRELGITRLRYPVLNILGRKSWEQSTELNKLDLRFIDVDDNASAEGVVTMYQRI